MAQLSVFQSLRAMERRHTVGHERTLEKNVEMIVDGGYDGVSGDFRNRDYIRRLSGLLNAGGLQAEGQCYPKTVYDLTPVLGNAVEFGIRHIAIQPDIRPRRLRECIPIVEGRRRLAEPVDFPVLIETHRDRMTTDLYFTLDLLECFPDPKLLGDLSHFLVGREFKVPISEKDHALIHRMLDNVWAFSRPRCQPGASSDRAFVSPPQDVDRYLHGLVGYSFRSWRKRAGDDDHVVFTCELGPKPYAITGPDGNDTTDRWKEALEMKAVVKSLWGEIVQT